jgi:galactosylceramidase
MTVSWAFIFIAAGWLGVSRADEAKPDALAVIHLDGSKEGRTFEGIGALSAGGASRLVIDYSEPVRSQILDLLFKPHYGAAFQHLKVEVGGDVNSTMGSEPSHMHERDDENHTRGYEWWLMKEAKRRNPAVLLDCLEWGTPGWIGDGKFYSQDNADYLVKFIQGVKTVHGLQMDYVGIWNERAYDTAWIKLLRKTLDRNDLKSVKIVAADEITTWTIADKMKDDSELAAAIDVVGVHYPNYKSTPTAQACGKSLWSTEDGWGSKGGWAGAAMVGKMLNRNYAEGKMTKTVVWGLLTSYYDSCSWPDCGILHASYPWSGHYYVHPALWATAHTTQFAEPGWKYLDGGACGLLAPGGSYVTLKSANGKDYSVVVETFDAKQPQTVTVQLAGGLSLSDVHVWRTNPHAQFIRLDDLKVTDASFTVTLDPNSMYSFTTTTGQRKGEPPIPPQRPFPMPYKDDFEDAPPAAEGKYFAAMSGSFDVAARADGKGKCLRQTTPRPGIHWTYDPEPETFLGSPDWSDYTVAADVHLEKSGTVGIFGRVMLLPQETKWLDGYCFKIDQEGKWELKTHKAQLATGKIDFDPEKWHRMEMAFSGGSIRVHLDGAELAEVHDTTFRAGMAGLGTGWNVAEFDNFAVSP